MGPGPGCPRFKLNSPRGMSGGLSGSSQEQLCQLPCEQMFLRSYFKKKRSEKVPAAGCSLPAHRVGARQTQTPRCTWAAGRCSPFLGVLNFPGSRGTPEKNHHVFHREFNTFRKLLTSWEPPRTLSGGWCWPSTSDQHSCFL